MLEGKKCLVIGSGISGIGAAVLLEKNHADVVLYDSSDKLTGEDLKAKLLAMTDQLTEEEKNQPGGKQGGLHRRRTS